MFKWQKLSHLLKKITADESKEALFKAVSVGHAAASDGDHKALMPLSLSKKVMTFE